MSGEGGVRIIFDGCGPGEECDIGYFRLEGLPGTARVEVRTTKQIEHLLAHQLGRESLTLREREAILDVGGRRLIAQRLQETGGVDEVMLLDSTIFRRHGEERELLREAGLLRGKPEHPQP